MTKTKLRDASAAVTVAIALLLACTISLGSTAAAEKVYTKTFRSPSFTLGPGDVADKYMVVDMPQGHIALRSFNTQVVNEDGVPVPLYETYLHHWVLHRFYDPTSSGGLRKPELASNNGICGSGQLTQLFGLGSETRLTDTEIPAPYGIVIGDPERVPAGYDEEWVLNVHAIDTRGTVDSRGCTECVCELYNVSVGYTGKPIPAGYEGGLDCCFDDTHCILRPEYSGPERVLYMEYYVSWVDMSDEVVPVTVYILDVTDGKKSIDEADTCEVEYTVPKCPEGESNCIHKAENVNFFPVGGDVVYGVAHQHSGGIGSTLYNEDGTEICTSNPTYGNGTDPGDEAGYIVGMSTCYPTPGATKVRAGEKLRLVSSYSSDDRHTGVMGLFYLLIDESKAPPPPQDNHYSSWIVGSLTIIAAFALIGAIVSRQMKLKNRGGPEYEQIRV